MELESFQIVRRYTGCFIIDALLQYSVLYRITTNTSLLIELFSIYFENMTSVLTVRYLSSL